MVTARVAMTRESRVVFFILGLVWMCFDAGRSIPQRYWA
jgi:hypothetical protein